MEEEIKEEVVQEEVQEQPVEAPKEEPVAEKNWRQMREMKEKAEKERDEAIALIQQLAQNKQPQQPQAPVEEEFTVGDDDFIEGRHYNKFRQQMKREIEETKRQIIEQNAEYQIKAQYPDFDKVVSDQNIKMLREMYPEIANSINHNPDLRSKAVAAYTLIKQFGINSDQYEQDKQKVQQNLAKPRTTASISPQANNSALDNARAFEGGLTDDVKQQLWKEMQDAIKRR